MLILSSGALLLVGFGFLCCCCCCGSEDLSLLGKPPITLTSTNPVEQKILDSNYYKATRAIAYNSLEHKVLRSWWGWLMRLSEGGWKKMIVRLPAIFKICCCLRLLGLMGYIGVGGRSVPPVGTSVALIIVPHDQDRRFRTWIFLDD